MTRLVAWFHYRGWRNVAWRHEWVVATCHHDITEWRDNIFFCPACQTVIAYRLGPAKR